MMEKDKNFGSEYALGMRSLPALTVGIAVSGSRKSRNVVRWALEKFAHEENTVFKMIHVRPTITSVPTAMGNYIPLSQVRDDVAAAYAKEMEWKTTEMLLPYKKMCLQKEVEVEVLIIESDDVENAIADEVIKHKARKLVIGASSRGLFTRRNKNTMSSRISECSPSFCTVYAVSGEKLSSIRPSDADTNISMRDDSSEGGASSTSTNSSLSYSSSLRTDLGSSASYSHFHTPSLPQQRFQALSSINQSLNHTRTSSIDTNQSRWYMDVEEREDGMSSCPTTAELGDELGQISSPVRLVADNPSWISDHASTSDVVAGYSTTKNQVDINFELEKLRVELRHVRGMYAMAHTETIDASRKLSDLSQRRSEEAMMFKEIKLKEDEAKELAIKENERYEVIQREADYLKERMEKEALRRQEAEMKASLDAQEKEKLETALVGQLFQYRKFTWDEIEAATSSFSENLRIGKGAYGTVYKCSLHHTTAAVKVLHSNEKKLAKQFQQELDVLSKIRHPHLLLLLGACAEHGCLVYEYMENGNLEERLLQVNDTPPIKWFERYRIAWEVASALVFLHHSKPKQIIHRDLKPANILLDHNFVSKIGDVGLSMMVQSDPLSVSAIYKDTGPVGTLCYIDPEYQRTGLVSPKSDVYAFGMVILQLLTGKPARALAHLVETAIDEGNLVDILDPKAGSWPADETRELAMLGLSCAEIRRRDRPDLKEQVLPILEKLKKVADVARESISSIQAVPPNHFICPILKDIINDPCVAADGYTYERKAIEKWLEVNEKSPMTNLTLPNKNLLPNFTLLSAIVEWKSSKIITPS